MLLIDVRTTPEYEEGHLRNTILIEYQKIANEIEIYTENKNEIIGLYCSAGIRSGIAQRTLLDLGYLNVINLGGYLTLKEVFSFVDH